MCQVVFVGLDRKSNIFPMGRNEEKPEKGNPAEKENDPERPDFHGEETSK